MGTRPFVMMLLLLLPSVAGCIDLGKFLPNFENDPLVDRSGEPESAAHAYAGTRAWMNSSTTRVEADGIDPTGGHNFSDNDYRLSYSNPNQGPFYVAAEPIPLKLWTMQGNTNWSRVGNVLTAGNVQFFQHVEYSDWAFDAIHGEHFPEDYQPTDEDGVASYWEQSFAVEWKENHQDEWTVEWWGNSIWWNHRYFDQAWTQKCSNTSDGLNWIDSTDAMQIAAASPEFMAARTANFDGVLRMEMKFQPDLPRYRGENETCNDAPVMQWRIDWIDFNGLIEAGGNLPLAAGNLTTVIIDAQTSDVVDVRQTVMRYPGYYREHQVLNVTDSRTNPCDDACFTFEVAPSQVGLQLEHRQDGTPIRPSAVTDTSYNLHSPSGEEFLAGNWYGNMYYPESGTWSVTRNQLGTDDPAREHTLTVTTYD